MSQFLTRIRPPALLVASACLILGICGCLRQDASDPAAMTEEAWQTHEDSIDRLRHVPDEKMGYEQVVEINTGLDNPAGIVIGQDSRLWIVGDQGLHQLREGRPPSRYETFDTPATCLAVAGGTTMYVGHEESVSVVYPVTATGRNYAIELGPRAYATSIAADEDTVYIADAAQRKIHIYDTNGNKQGEIAKDEETGFGGFIIPSPHFDVILDGKRLITTNPGRQKIVTFINDKYVGGWGEFGQDLEGFCGCCNPTDIALLPDGRIVTAEKGLPRIKIYTADGKLDTVVAAPDSVSRTAKGFDLATDAEGRIYALDKPAKVVRVYQPKHTAVEESP